MSEEFKIKVGEFEGPLDVLLRLIEERELHISQVSLAAVADSFIEHMRKLGGDLEKGVMANFILIASTLMLIKSISLLPTLPTTPEEQESMADLERRLKLYQRTKELSERVRERFGRQLIFARQESRELTAIFAPSRDLTLDNLIQALRTVIQSFPKVEAIPKVIIKKVISLEEAINDLAKRVQSALKMSFKDFVKDKADKVNVIVSFLGMLELVKRGVVDVQQSAHFDDIAIETTGPTDTPKYL